jgi:hypothetical protein
MTAISGYNQYFPKSNKKMYASIYKQVMDPKPSPRQAFATEGPSPFDSYRQVWNKYQDTHDREFQKELKIKNKQTNERMREADEKRIN